MLDSLKKGNQVLMLQTQDLRVNQEKEPCIRVNTRELNGELCIR